jgi:hypothetical protein
MLITTIEASARISILIAFTVRIYDSTPPLDPHFPSEIPSIGAKAALPPAGQKLPYTDVRELDHGAKKVLLEHAPPNPCYRSLGNNVATPLLKYKDLDWPKDTVTILYLPFWYNGILTDERKC